MTATTRAPASRSRSRASSSRSPTTRAPARSKTVVSADFERAEVSASARFHVAGVRLASRRRSRPIPSTAKDHLDARLRQISLFLPNRLGALRRAIDVLERGDVRIAGISVLEAADHAVVRLVVDRPEAALKSLGDAGYGVSPTDILGVSLPAGPRFGMQRVLSVLLSAEVSLMYVNGLILSDHGQPILALRADDLDLAARVLEKSGFRILDQEDLAWPTAPE